MKAHRDNPGVPLGQYREVDFDVLLSCLDCLKSTILKREAVIKQLEARGTGGAHTGILELARMVQQPCGRCGGSRFDTRPYRNSGGPG
jgi:hypothetical protein